MFRKLFKEKVVFLDCEYLHKALERGERPNFEKDWMRIVQMGAVKMRFDTDPPEEIDYFNKIIHPTNIPHTTKLMWDRMEEITGITKEIIETGGDFLETFNSFQEFVDDCPVVIMMGDEDVLIHHAASLGLKWDSLGYIRLKPLLLPLGIDCCSGELYKLIEKPFDTHNMKTHNALFDVRSMVFFILNK